MMNFDGWIYTYTLGDTGCLNNFEKNHSHISLIGQEIFDLEIKKAGAGKEK